MDWSLRRLTLNQLDQKVQGLQNIQRPVNGWVRSIRNALGMTGKQLARRVGVSAERIVKIEADELDKKLTMATLEKVAQAMNCEFVYGFVPKDEGFKGIIEQQAQLRAREQLKEVMHTMILEDQKTSKAAVKTQLSILSEEWLHKNIKTLWDK